MRSKGLSHSYNLPFILTEAKFILWLCRSGKEVPISAVTIGKSRKLPSRYLAIFSFKDRWSHALNLGPNKERKRGLPQTPQSSTYPRGRRDREPDPSSTHLYCCGDKTTARQSLHIQRTGAWACRVHRQKPGPECMPGLRARRRRDQLWALTGPVKTAFSTKAMGLTMHNILNYFLFIFKASLNLLRNKLPSLSQIDYHMMHL